MNRALEVGLKQTFSGRGERLPWALLTAWTLTLLVVSLAAHETPLYLVETDLVGEYIPTARELATGQLSASRYAFRGPGYPALLAAAAWLLGGDFFLAARVLSVLAASASAGLAWGLTRSAGGNVLGAFVLAGVLVNPVFVHHSIEAGTDTRHWHSSWGRPCCFFNRPATWGSCYQAFSAASPS